MESGTNNAERTSHCRSSHVQSEAGPMLIFHLLPVFFFAAVTIGQDDSLTFRLEYCNNRTNWWTIMSGMVAACKSRWFTYWIQNNCDYNKRLNHFRINFRIKIGIFSVNFTDPTLPRTPKASARYYAKIVQNDGFIGDQPCDKRAIDGSQGSRFFNYFRFGDIIFYSSSSQIETVSTIVRKKLCKL